jgi:hypothetical protein
VATEINIGGTWRPCDELALPDGWLLRRGLAPDHPALELFDPDGNRVAALSPGDPTALTIEGAWRGVGYSDLAMHWWALAFGRADRCVPLSVTFTGRNPHGSRGRRGGLPARTVVAPVVADGLWAAVVPGLQLAVTCRQGAQVTVRHIEPLPGRWPLAARCDQEGTG